MLNSDLDSNKYIPLRISNPINKNIEPQVEIVELIKNSEQSSEHLEEVYLSKSYESIEDHSSNSLIP